VQIEAPSACSRAAVSRAPRMAAASAWSLYGKQSVNTGSWLKRQDGGYFNPSIADPNALPDDSR
jgi:hypothetical protein